MRNTSETLLTTQRLFNETGALMKGHFELSSGRHSDTYMQCAKVLQYPMKAAFLGKAIADELHEITHEISPADLVVVSPAMGGIIIGQEVARAIGTQRTHHVPHMFLERTASGFQLRRGFELDSTKSVIIVEDVVTTGVSTSEAMVSVRLRGAKVVAVASLINRATGHLPFGSVPYEYLLRVEAEHWYPEQCSLCLQGKQVEKPGSRGEIPRLL